MYYFEHNSELAMRLREELAIDCVPQVILLDRNLEIVWTQGAQELMKMDTLTPEIVRALWINVLKQQIEEKKQLRMAASNSGVIPS
jgi:hypothetical protein